MYTKNSFSRKANKDATKPGFYVARCDSVKVDEDYVDPVILVKYTFVNKSGVKISFSERFVEKCGFERTVAFFDYLSENNISDVEELVGKFEKIRVAWHFSKSGNRFPTIAEREFITQEAFESREVLSDA